MAATQYEPPPSYDLEIGRRVHEVIAEYGRRGERPDVESLFEEVAEVVRRLPFAGRRRPGPQRTAALTAVGLGLMPPTDWTFVGSEVRFGRGRVDLIWQAPNGFLPAPGAIVIDELKAGAMPGHLAAGEVTEQVARYVRYGEVTYGVLFVGVRLIALSLPPSSVLYRPSSDGPVAEPLEGTDYWFGPRPGEVI